MTTQFLLLKQRSTLEEQSSEAQQREKEISLVFKFKKFILTFKESKI